MDDPNPNIEKLNEVQDRITKCLKSELMDAVSRGFFPSIEPFDVVTYLTVEEIAQMADGSSQCMTIIEERLIDLVSWFNKLGNRREEWIAKIAQRKASQ